MISWAPVEMARKPHSIFEWIVGPTYQKQASAALKEQKLHFRRHKSSSRVHIAKEETKTESPPEKQAAKAAATPVKPSPKKPTSPKLRRTSTPSYSRTKPFFAGTSATPKFKDPVDSYSTSESSDSSNDDDKTASDRYFTTAQDAQLVRLVYDRKQTWQDIARALAKPQGIVRLRFKYLKDRSSRKSSSAQWDVPSTVSTTSALFGSSSASSASSVAGNPRTKPPAHYDAAESTTESDSSRYYSDDDDSIIANLSIDDSSSESESESSESSDSSDSSESDSLSEKKGEEYINLAVPQNLFKDTNEQLDTPTPKARVRPSVIPTEIKPPVTKENPEPPITNDTVKKTFVVNSVLIPAPENATTNSNTLKSPRSHKSFDIPKSSKSPGSLKSPTSLKSPRLGKEETVPSSLRKDSPRPGSATKKEFKALMKQEEAIILDDIMNEKIPSRVMLSEDVEWTATELNCIAEFINEDYIEKWLRVASKFYDRTGRRVHPEAIRAKVEGSRRTFLPPTFPEV